MAKRGPKKWRWFNEPIAAECKGCRMRWDSVFEVYRLGKCPGCGYTPEDAREAERLRRASYRRPAAPPTTPAGMLDFTCWVCKTVHAEDAPCPPTSELPPKCMLCGMYEDMAIHRLTYKARYHEFMPRKRR